MFNNMCEITNEIVQPFLDEVIKNSETKWSGSKYDLIQKASNSEKGKFGEKVTNAYLNQIDYKSEIINGGIGDFDILLESVNAILKIEHKLATEDVHNSFQFNGIKKEIDYDYVFCLGVSPNDLWFRIRSREWCEQTLTTNMSKDVIGAYKYTVRKDLMLPLTEENFKEEIEKIVK